jgi:transcriptional regulator with XRE-family HTH domain
MSDGLRKRLAHTVSLWMEAKGLTVLSLSKSTGLGRATIYRLVNGEGDTSIETLVRVASDLGTTAAALLDGRDPGYVSPPSLRHDQAQPVSDRLEALEERVDLLTRQIARMAASSAAAAEQVERELEAGAQRHGKRRHGT